MSFSLKKTVLSEQIMTAELWKGTHDNIFSSQIVTNPITFPAFLGTDLYKCFKTEKCRMSMGFYISQAD